MSVEYIKYSLNSFFMIVVDFLVYICLFILFKIFV
jgi:hypothetical protein